VTARIGALVPVRLASERLPGKALLPLAGRPVLAHLVDRLAAVPQLAHDRIVICTTRDASDDPLVGACAALGVPVYRGSRDDLIDRMHDAARVFGFDIVVEADGDDPCPDPAYLAGCLAVLLGDPTIDIASTEALPVGLNVRAFRVTALQRVREHRITTRNDTGFMYFFTRTGLCRHAVVPVASEAHRHDTARVTLDYPEDLVFFETVFHALGRDGRLFDVGDLVSFLRSRPDVVAINAGLAQRYRERTRELARLEYQVGGVTREVPL
jgi:spore coat polysaccharide biosynthesis protein SpsF